MGCNPILECHCRVIAALTLALGVNRPLRALGSHRKKKRRKNSHVSDFLIVFGINVFDRIGDHYSEIVTVSVHKTLLDLCNVIIQRHDVTLFDMSVDKTLTVSSFWHFPIPYSNPRHILRPNLHLNSEKKYLNIIIVFKRWIDATLYHLGEKTNFP